MFKVAVRCHLSVLTSTQRCKLRPVGGITGNTVLTGGRHYSTGEQTSTRQVSRITSITGSELWLTVWVAVQGFSSFTLGRVILKFWDWLPYTVSCYAVPAVIHFLFMLKAFSLFFCSHPSNYLCRTTVIDNFHPSQDTPPSLIQLLCSSFCCFLWQNNTIIISEAELIVLVLHSVKRSLNQLFQFILFLSSSSSWETQKVWAYCKLISIYICQINGVQVETDDK